MDSATITAKTRDTLGKKVKVLRRQGQLPVVLYGHGTETKHLSVDAKQFGQLFKEAGTSTLVDVTIDEQKPVKVLIHGSQVHPVTGQLVHADLFQVKLDEKIQTEIPLTFIGESPAVADLEGNLVTPKTTLKVEAFPQDLVSEIEVDIAALQTFENKITIANITVPATITLLDDPEETVAVVTPPRTEEELAEELAETTAEEEQAAVAATEEASAEEGEAGEESETQEPASE